MDRCRKGNALRTLGADFSSYYTKEDVDALLAAPSSAAYPVGSICQSTDPTSPAALFGGTWEQIASERVLMGASSSHKSGHHREGRTAEHHGYSQWRCIVRVNPPKVMELLEPRITIAVCRI